MTPMQKCKDGLNVLRGFVLVLQCITFSLPKSGRYSYLYSKNAACRWMWENGRCPWNLVHFSLYMNTEWVPYSQHWSCLITSNEPIIKGMLPARKVWPDWTIIAVLYCHVWCAFFNFTHFSRKFASQFVPMSRTKKAPNAKHVLRTQSSKIHQNRLRLALFTQTLLESLQRSSRPPQLFLGQRAH